MEYLKKRIEALMRIFGIAQNNLVTLQGQKILATAKSLLGTDASPADIAPDELGCAETVSDVIIKAGFPMPVIVSTAELWRFFSGSDDWIEVVHCLPGDIIISPTGQGGKNGITHGHTGIIIEGEKIMSNDSATGKFIPNYTIASWTARYKVKGGFNIYFFRRVN